MGEGGKGPYLLTPGPLTTSDPVREAMLRDWGSRDHAFIEMTRRVRDRLVALAGGGERFTAVPIQGSGTFAIEAMLGTLVPQGAKALVLINGSYGKRIARILEIIGRGFAVYETDEDTPPDVAVVARRLAAEAAISHVVAVHCETTSGILNPVEAIADVVAAAGRCLLIDAMSSFGALDLDLCAIPCEAVVASANKCLEGVPGLSYAIVEKAALESAAGNAHSLSLDLHDQWRGFERNGQWRFTPPTHVLAAFDRALVDHADGGGVAGRGARYARNCQVLVDGMRALGFETFLPDALQAPIIVTFHSPADPAYDFGVFYDGLARRGYVIYPGKLTALDTFRIGCIGALGETELEGAVAAVAEVLAEMGVENRGRAAA